MTIRKNIYPDGGRAHKVSDSVYHLMRGEVFDICGYSFFCFGGAASHNTDSLLDLLNDPNWKRKRAKLNRSYESFRIIGKTWWAREEADLEEQEHGIATLEERGWKCDFVLTHTPPASIVELISGGEKKPDRTSSYLQQIREKLDYKHWFCGHMHTDADPTQFDHILYRKIFLLTSK